MSSFFTGLLGGFQEAKQAHEKDQFERAQLASQREAAVYQTLLQSDRADVQQMAIAGLLESAQTPKKAKGIRGWLGEMETSPTYQRMQALISQPQVTTETTLPSRQMVPPASGAIQPAVITSNNGPQSAAMPEGNKIEPQAQAAAPPPPLQYTESPGVTSTTVAPPPPVFLSPEARLIAGAKAKGLAAGLELEGKADATYNAMRRWTSDDEARKAVKVMFGVEAKATNPTAAALRDQFAGNVMGENITPEEWTQSGHTEPIDPKQMYRRMTNAAGATKYFPVDSQSSANPQVRQFADPISGQPYLGQINRDTDGTPYVVPIGPVPATLRYLTHVAADGTVTYMPVRPYAAPGVPTSTAPAGGPPTAGPSAQGVAPPPASPTTRSGAGGPPVPGGGATPPPKTSGAGQPPAAAARAAQGGPPARSGPGGIPGGVRPVNFEKTAAAVLNPDGETIDIVQVNRNPRTNALTDQVTGKPVSGAVALTEPMAATIQGQKLLKVQMDDIEGKVKELLPSTTGVLRGQAAGVQTQLKRTLDKNYDARYKGLISAVNEAAGQVRKIQGQSGAESERDYLRALTGLTELSTSLTTGDTQEAVMERLSTTKNALKTAQDRFITQLRTAGSGASPILPPGIESRLADLAEGHARTIDGVEYAKVDGKIQRVK